MLTHLFLLFPSADSLGVPAAGEERRPSESSTDGKNRSPSPEDLVPLWKQTPSRHRFGDVFFKQHFSFLFFLFPIFLLLHRFTLPFPCPRHDGIPVRSLFVGCSQKHSMLTQKLRSFLPCYENLSTLKSKVIFCSTWWTHRD